MSKVRVICFLLIATFIIIPFPLSSAQTTDEDIFDQIRREHELVEKFAHEPRPARSELIAEAIGAPSQPIDVKHYRLEIELLPETASVAGAVTITAETTATVSEINIDANDNLTIDSLLVDGQPRQFARTKRLITISFPAQLAPRTTLAILIRYHGAAIISDTLGGGMFSTKHGDNKVTVMANLSEPYAAPTWWPCIDDQTDKATIEIAATAPEGYQVASNGVLETAQANPNHTTTFFWRTASPLSTYLVSVAATNYVKFEDTYTSLDGSTRMPLVYYVYPEHEAVARERFAVTREAISMFAGLFGEYPFLNEKYGMAEFPWGGAMEHQTMTSMGANIVGAPFVGGRGISTGSSVIVHELAHQWWGDLVTMKSWNDIWLNEGFATYAEVLFYERYLNISPGSIMRNSYDDGQVDGRLGGTVNAEDVSDPFDDTGAIYNKGGWVLHMLRHIIGDDKFFAALKDYARQYGFSNASTRDFQQVMEQYYGASLEWFFEQWIYAAGRPVYKVSTDISPSGAGYAITLTIKQKQSQQIPGRGQSVYIMPLDVTIHYADGSREIRRVMNDARKQHFTFTTTKQPASIALDEDNWVLKRVK